MCSPRPQWWRLEPRCVPQALAQSGAAGTPVPQTMGPHGPSVPAPRVWICASVTHAHMLKRSCAERVSVWNPGVQSPADSSSEYRLGTQRAGAMAWRPKNQPVSQHPIQAPAPDPAAPLLLRLPANSLARQQRTGQCLVLCPRGGLEEAPGFGHLGAGQQLGGALPPSAFSLCSSALQIKINLEKILQRVWSLA